MTNLVMKLDKALAVEIRDSVLAMSRVLDDSVREVLTEWKEGQPFIYKRLAGQVMGLLFTNVLASIYQTYPELEPEEIRKARLDGASMARMPEALAMKILRITHDLRGQLEILAARINAADASSQADGLNPGIDEIFAALRDTQTFIRYSSEMDPSPSTDS